MVEREWGRLQKLEIGQTRKYIPNIIFNSRLYELLLYILRCDVSDVSKGM
jgi:hypothetical protein